MLHIHDQFLHSRNTFVVARHRRLELYVPLLLNAMVCIFSVLSPQSECYCPLRNGCLGPFLVLNVSSVTML